MTEGRAPVRSRPTRRDRRATVTDEPFRIDRSLLGVPLATLPRRALGFVVDSVLAMLIAFPLILVVAVAAIWWQAPAILAEGSAGLVGRADFSEEQWQSYHADLLRLVQRRRPGVLPSDLVEALDRDPAALAAAIDDSGLSYNFALGSGEPSQYDPARGTLFVREDVLLGPFDGFISFLSVFVGYFSLLGMRGRTPGKWLAGVRVVALDGRPMTLWTAFQRAGGYGASFSTFGLGFAQAIRDPNRQALHDKIASTAVIRAPRRRSRSQPPDSPESAPEADRDAGAPAES